MQDRINSLFSPHKEDFGALLCSEQPAIPPIGFPSLPSFFGGCGLDLNFPQEIEYLPPAGISKMRDMSFYNPHSDEFDEASFPFHSPFKFPKCKFEPGLEDEYTPSTTPPVSFESPQGFKSTTKSTVNDIRYSSTSSWSDKRIISVQICSERKTSIVTTLCDGSAEDITYHPKMCFSVEKEACPEGLQPLKSVKISIGPFNSVNQEKELPFSLGAKVTKTEKNAEPSKHCCNCKKSRCLKLYCECFANGTYCQGCNCCDCLNTKFHQKEIEIAKRIINDKNPVALKRRMAEQDKSSITCNCSKSGCLKKYCECFKNGKKCGSGCNCTGCKNTEALRTISYDRVTKQSRKVHRSMVYQF